MAPRPQARSSHPVIATVTSPIEPSVAQNFNGVHLNYEYNINIPVWLLDQKWWDTKAGGRKPSTDVIRVYAWLLDKVTSCEVEDGVILGTVLGGRKLSHLEIGSTFGVSWSGVQRATAYLVKVGLISRVQNCRTKEHSYTVLHCRKFEVKQVPKNLPAGTTVAGTYKGKTIYHTPPQLPLSSPPVIDADIEYRDQQPTSFIIDACEICGKTCDPSGLDDLADLCMCMNGKDELDDDELDDDELDDDELDDDELDDDELELPR
jgi:hypothetical protein